MLNFPRTLLRAIFATDKPSGLIFIALLIGSLLAGYEHVLSLIG